MKKKNHNQFIRYPEQIEDLSLQKHYEYAILLGQGGFFSRKTIKYNPKTEKYTVTNHIDDTTQHLTRKQLLNRNYTNIREAMLNRALICIID